MSSPNVVDTTTTTTTDDFVRPGGAITEFLLQEDIFNIDKTDHSFRNTLRSNLTSIIDHRLVPYIIELFDRYTEQDFHQKMRNMYLHNGKMYTGFNFIADWKKNHRYYWRMFVGAARVNRKFLKFNHDSLLHKITYIMYMKGWTLYDYEIEGLRQTVGRIYNIMYLGNDL
jgi:hypothetical protein